MFSYYPVNLAGNGGKKDRIARCPIMSAAAISTAAKAGFAFGEALQLNVTFGRSYRYPRLDARGGIR